uniref:Tumor necrosis factor n=1 Tax=Myripristis murdjan TaxID=586833 RepID=A0A667WQZ7_9TELE
MASYTMAPGTVEAGLGERTVVVVEKIASSRWRWRVCSVVFIVSLCVAGALLFAWYWSGRPERMMQSGQKEALIEKETSKATDPHNTLRQISSKAKAAIHLVVSTGNFKGQVEWKNDRGPAFAQGGFKLQDNKIIIPRTGLYFVYSQASFRVTCNDEDDNGNAGRHFTPLSHTVLRFSDSIGGDASLMSVVRSACQSSAHEDSTRIGEGWYNALYLGAVFQLNKGDKLWTETNQLAELETEGDKTFFGVFAL